MRAGDQKLRFDLVWPYTVLPAILPAVEGIILRMLRAFKKTCTKNLRKRKKKLSKQGFEPGHPYS